MTFISFRCNFGPGLAGTSIGAVSTGIPKLISGSVKKKRIELELFRTQGTASINGVGVRIWF